MIIAHLMYDTQSLTACATTCLAWYYAAAPHLHHTLVLRHWHPDPARKGLNPLPALAELGLLPLVKKVQFRSHASNNPWVTPTLFDPRSLHDFSALAHVHDLTIEDLYFPFFKKGVEKYFGHLSPTLRSVALTRPRCHPRQLLDFLRLFPRLDNVKIVNYGAMVKRRATPDTPHVPIVGPFRGKLTIINLLEEGVLRDFVNASGRVRFISMDLNDVPEMQLLLDACAETLETLRIYPNGVLQFCKRFSKSMLQYLS